MNLKKLHKKKKDLGNSVNLIPMINLIFLLLIFFLLTGVIRKKDSNEIEKPISFFGEEKKNIENLKVLKLDYKNQIFFEERQITINQIKSNFNAEDNNLILEIDKNSDIFFFNKIMKELKEKNIKKIFIKVEEEISDL